MQKELVRLDGCLKKFPDIDLSIISKDTAMGKAYWNWIKEFINTKKKPKIFSQSKKSIFGLDPKNALVILCGHWYMNPIFEEGFFRYMLKDVMITLPIGEISR